MTVKKFDDANEAELFIDPEFTKDLTVFAKEHPKNPYAGVEFESDEALIAAVATAVMLGDEINKDHADDKAEELRRSLLTPEMREQEDKASLEHHLALRRKWAQEDLDRRQAMYAHRADLADKWAAKPDLTPHERTHGVVWELYKEDGDAKTINNETGRIDQVYQPAQEYAVVYDTRQADVIKAGLARSAVDLFN